MLKFELFVPTFTAPILASSHHSHRGTINTLIGGQCGNRALGDFLQLRTGPFGEAQIGYADSNSITGAFAPHGMFVRQNGGRRIIGHESYGKHRRHQALQRSV